MTNMKLVSNNLYCFYVVAGKRSDVLYASVHISASDFMGRLFSVLYYFGEGQCALCPDFDDDYLFNNFAAIFCNLNYLLVFKSVFPIVWL